jgi:DNA-binding IscR family transcriptional regulator
VPVDIPAKSDYAVRAMLALTELTDGDPNQLATVEQLSASQDLPRKFLEVILRDLRRGAGIHWPLRPERSPSA